MLGERQMGWGGAQVMVADCMGLGWGVGAESGGHGKKKRWANVWEQESGIWRASILHLNLLNVIFTATLEISIIISNFTKEETEAQRGIVVGPGHTARKKVSPGLFPAWFSTSGSKTVQSVDSLAPEILDLGTV